MMARSDAECRDASVKVLDEVNVKLSPARKKWQTGGV